jgi:hypothetical protein
MSDFIISYPNTLTEMLCDDIVEKYHEYSSENNYTIPKNSNEWKKIELNIYKQLLLKVNDYKNKILLMDSNKKTFELIQMLNEDLYIKDFVIQVINKQTNKYNRENNRNNTITFVYFLKNSFEEIHFNTLIVKPQKGLLLLFPDSLHNFYTINQNEPQLVISGQLTYNVFL